VRSHRLQALLFEQLDHVFSELLGLGCWRILTPARNEFIHPIVPVVESIRPQCSGSYGFGASESLLVLRIEPLRLLELAVELSLTALVVLVNVKEVVDCLTVFLVELGAESLEYALELPDIYISRIIDIATTE